MTADDPEMHPLRSAAAEASPSPLLGRIACALGCSVEAFLRRDGSGTDAESRQMLELIGLWHALRDPAERLQILSQLRAAVGRQQAD